MSSSQRGVSRWTRYFLLVGAAGFVAARLALVVGVPLLTTVWILLFLFVFPIVFGQAYLLVPSYAGRAFFDSRVTALHFGVTVLAGIGLVLSALYAGTAWLRPIGVGLWTVGIALFLGGLVWTVRDRCRPAYVLEVIRSDESPTPFRAFVPVAFGYLSIGTLALVSSTTSGLSIVGSTPSVVHLYLAGTAASLIFALGSHLVPRFFRADVSHWLVVGTLGTGAVGPALLVAGFQSWNPAWLLAGGGLLSVAFLGYAGFVLEAFVTGSRNGIGHYGIVGGAIAGVFGAVAGLGLALAISASGFGTGLLLGSSKLLPMHLRVMLDGFLSLTILGYVIEFYPQRSDGFGGGDVVAGSSLLFVGLGLVLYCAGLVQGTRALQLLGDGTTLLGALVLLILVFHRLYLDFR